MVELTLYIFMTVATVTKYWPHEYPHTFQSLEECQQAMKKPTQEMNEWVKKHFILYDKAGYRPSVGMSYGECNPLEVTRQ